MNVRCPHCGRALAIDGAYAGRALSCVFCGGSFTAPRPHAQRILPRRRKKTKPLVITLAVVFVLAMIGWTIQGITGVPPRSSRNTRPRQAVTSVQAPLPAGCVLLKEEESDTPIKTQVVQYLQAPKEWTPEQMRRFLAKRFKEIQKRRGYQYHEKPTNVFLYLYFSRREYQDTTAGWVAMLSFTPGYATASVRVRDELIAVRQQGPQMRFGLTEGQRKKIYRDIVSMEDVFMEDPETVEKAAKAVARKYGLTTEQIHKIGAEGVRNHWPMP